MGIDWNLAGAVILSGMVFVFAILCALIAIVWLVGKVLGATTRKAPEPETASVSVAAPVAVPPGQSGVDQGEIVAAISGAIYAYMQETAPGVPYTVTSVVRSQDSRPVWGFAGMQQNTRPW